MWSHPKLSEKYEILEQLGEGNRTRVMRVRSRNVPRDFAVKIFTFTHGKDGEHSRERARREAKALSALQHPHVVTLFEVIELDQSRLALVMDYIEGVRLDRYIKRNGPLEPGLALELTRQLAAALYEAHRQKLIHRDVKPENVIVRGLASGDLFVHLFDFGIVRGPNPSSLTQGFIGSPQFASPEQSQGGEVDARTDVFGLGGTLYFMLTGKPPFSDSTWEAMLERQFEKPAPVSDVQRVPQQLEDLITEMMASDPDDRPEQMKAVVSRIRVIDELEPESEGLGATSTMAESPPILLIPADPSEVTEVSNGWNAERVTELVVGPHVLATRDTSIGFLDQNLDIHVIDPSSGMRRDMKVDLDEAPLALEIWRGGVLALLPDGRVDGWSWEGNRHSVRQPDEAVTSLASFADGRPILGLESGECVIEQPNGSWKTQRVGRSEVEVIAATRDAVAISTPDGSMLVSALSFDVPLRHLGGPADALGFSSDSYLLAIARQGKFVLQNVESRSILSEGVLPPRTRRVAFHENDLCAYVVDNGQLLRFRLRT